MTYRFWLRALGVVLTLSLLWGVSEYRRAEELKIATENQYRRSLADFVTQLDSLETNLAKSRAAGTPTQQIYYLSQSSQQSNTAIKDLSFLPAKEFGLGYVDQFLNQIGEYTGILTQRIAKGDRLGAEQEKNLADMHDRLLTVNRDVQEFYVNLNTENIAWLDKGSGQASWNFRSPSTVPTAAQGDEGEQNKPTTVRSSLEQLDASLQKLPPFSYSGQTDTHAVPEPLGLPKSSLTEAEAQAIATDFLKIIGYDHPSPKAVGTSNGPLGGYIFEYESATVDVCKKGGVVTLFRDERPLGLQQLTVEQTVSRAMKTLKTIGWKEFVKTSTEDFGGYIQLEAVSEDQDVRIYPDKIRLTVGRDNGQITSYDSTPYWLYHHDRNLKPKLTLAEAKKKLRSDLAIKENRLAIISLPGWEEAFCYEFRGSINDEDFLVYINAQNGTEEKIQRIIRTPRGEFLQ